jgi:multicomponent Na+:H+ antiporter subunit D
VTNLLLTSPLLVPLATAAVLVLCRRRIAVQRALAVGGAAALLVCGVGLLCDVRASGIRAVQICDWPAPFGITLVADEFAAIMVVLAGIIGLAVVVYSCLDVDVARESFNYYALVHLLLMGVCGAFLTGDLFNLYVWFEVMLIASFVLLGLGGERGQLEGAIKYVTLNLLASAAFLAGIGILYGAAGTLNMADLAGRLDAFTDRRIPTVLAVLFLIAFGTKAAVFPLFFWLPASYHTPPAAISALFAGLLTKVGVYALVRVFTLLFVGEPEFTHTLLLVCAGLTMMTGVLGAVAQNEMRRILSFHIVSQIGYMVMGLALGTELALAGSVFYIAHHIIVKTNLFLVSGAVERWRGTGRLAALGGVSRESPVLAVLFVISAYSLAGVPPLSGFFAKLILVRAGLEIGQYAIVATALAVSLLTLYSMTKIWSGVFWESGPGGSPEAASHSSAAEGPRRNAPGLLLPIGGLAALTVAIGLACGPVFALASSAARQLLDRQAYIRAVLGESP